MNNLSKNVLYLNSKSKDSSSILKVFLTNFIKNDFFIDLINVNLYPSEFSGAISTTNGNTIIKYIDKFLFDLNKTARSLKLPNYNQLCNNINLARTILNIRESGVSIITYDNVTKHISSLDSAQRKLIDTTIDNKLTSSADFKKLTDELINNIEIYYEIWSISSSIIEFEQFTDYAASTSVSVYDAVKTFRDKIIQMYNDMSNLHAINKKESEKDYFIINDKDSTKELATALVDYLAEGYSSFATGYNFIDDNVDGIESGSIHMIAAPSNHGKSLFLANLAERILENNINDFDEADTIIILTLEDDYQKLTRRLCSIFGNYDQKTIKKLYRRSYEILRADKKTVIDPQIKDHIINIMDGVLNTSLYRRSQGKVNLIVKHCNEGEMSSSDLSKFIDLLAIENLNVRAVVLDYIDVMGTNISSAKDEYERQGDITNELRRLGRRYKIPILTATQNKRDAENMTTALNNTQIGDSYKKVRYSDYLYMCRMCSHLSVFSDGVFKFAFPVDMLDHNDPSKLSSEALQKETEISENLVPFEVKITKAKDGGRDEWCYMFFCKQNLKIYNNAREYLTELPYIIKTSKALEDDILLLSDMSSSSISENIFEDEFKQLSHFEFDDDQSVHDVVDFDNDELLSIAINAE